jgi:adenylate kinase
MKVYTEPLADIQTFYGAKNLHKIISGEGTIEEIVSEMNKYILEQI